VCEAAFWIMQTTWFLPLLAGVVIMLVVMKIVSSSNESANANDALNFAKPYRRYIFTPEICQRGFLDAVDSELQKEGSSSVQQRLEIANPHFAHCEPSLGISNTPIVTASQPVHNSSVFRPAQSILPNSSSSITFEFWIKPGIHNTTLLSIGRHQSNGSTPVGTITECQDFDFRFQIHVIASNNDSTPIQYAVSATYRTSQDDSTAFSFEPCQYLYSNEPLSLALDQLAHVVFVIQNHWQWIYINGKRLSGTAVGREPWHVSQWRNPFGLRLLDDDSSSDPKLYQFSIYDTEFVTENDVQELLLRQGLPPTLPFAYDQTISINEDAEEVPGSHSIDWYMRPPSLADAMTLDGPRVGWLDKEVKELLRQIYSHETDNKTDSFTDHDSAIFVAITECPKLGELYFDGQLVPRLDPPHVFPIGTAPIHGKLVYLPPFNAYGQVAVFRYCIAQELILVASQCQSYPSKVQIDVRLVNDPPVAVSVGPITIFEHNDERPYYRVPTITLHGKDVDDDGSDMNIQEVQISRPPKYGYLILAVPYFRQDRLRHGTRLSDLNFSIPGDGKEEVYVQYLFDSSSSAGVIVLDDRAKDWFSFRVCDQHGLCSAEETVEIQLVSRVSASADSLIIEEDSLPKVFTWNGKDGDSRHSNRTVGFLVEKLPSSRVGVLAEAASGVPLAIGFLNVTGPFENRVHLMFRPSPNFCHETDLSDIDSNVTFRAIAYGSEVISMSPAVSQQFSVVCTQDAIFMSLPSQEFVLFESSLKYTAAPVHCSVDDSKKKNDSVSTLKSNDCLGPFFITVNGIQFSSGDKRSATVKVIVSTTDDFTFMTFNPIHWNKTDPIVGRRSFFTGTVAFHAYPEDLTDIFSDLILESYRPGNGLIIVEIYDGICESESQNDTLALELVDPAVSLKTLPCQVLRHSIQYRVLRDSHKYKTKTHLRTNFPFQIFFCLIVYPALYAALIFVQNTCSQAGVDDDDTVVEGSPMEPLERFIQHEDENGIFYYEDTMDGTTRWDLPPGELFIPYDKLVNQGNK
jgi:hypothetical protein